VQPIALAIPAEPMTKENGLNPRALGEAVESREPEVLFGIGEAQEMLDPLNDTKKQIAWHGG
jgi:hypothetical protein